MKKITFYFVCCLISVVSYGQSPCDYTITLNDSFGDGWTGALLDVLVDNVVILDDITLQSGTTVTFALPNIADGQDITTVLVDGGTFPGDISYEIFDNLLTSVGTGDAANDITTPIIVMCGQLPDLPSCAINPTPLDGVVNLTLMDNNSVTLSWENCPSGGPVDSYNLFFGTTSGSLTDLGNFTTGQTINIPNLSFSTQYFWSIKNNNLAGSPTGCAEWSFTTSIPPNDACADAIVINNGDTLNGDNTAATNIENLTPCELGPIGTTCDANVNDVNLGTLIDFTVGLWYMYNSPGNESITIETFSPVSNLFDSEIQVFTGSCGALTCVVADDDSGFESNSKVCFDASVAADYYIYIDGHNGQTGAYTLSLNTSTTLSTTDFDDNSVFTYYPNPVKNTLTLNAQQTIENIIMYNMLGQEVIKVTPNTINSEIDMSELTSGAYFVKVTILGNTETIRVIKQ